MSESNKVANPTPKPSRSGGGKASGSVGKKQAPKKTAAKGPKGRPTAYVEKLHPKLGYALAVRGLTDEQMASEIGVTTSTFYLWQKIHPGFSEAIKRGKEEPDSKVEGALFKKATGYVEKVKKPMVVSQGAGAGSEVEIVEFDQTFEPSDTAIIFYLKNRRPDRWRDKQEVEHTGEVNLTNLTAEEFEKRKAELLARVGKK